jgi:hypothetical protein
LRQQIRIERLRDVHNGSRGFNEYPPTAPAFVRREALNFDSNAYAVKNLMLSPYGIDGG